MWTLREITSKPILTSQPTAVKKAVRPEPAWPAGRPVEGQRPLLHQGQIRLRLGLGFEHLGHEITWNAKCLKLYG